MKVVSIADESILRHSMGNVEEALRNLGVLDVVINKDAVHLVRIVPRTDGEETWEDYVSVAGKDLVEAYEKVKRGVEE